MQSEKATIIIIKYRLVLKCCAYACNVHSFPMLTLICGKLYCKMLSILYQYQVMIEKSLSK